MSQQQGFTLIEVLVSVIILAFGLLGLAYLQTAGLANNQSAYNRSQATLLASDIADRMRANPSVAANYAVTPDQLQATNCPNGKNPCTACISAANPCAPAQMAQKDLFEWKSALSTLPSGTGGIVVKGGVYTVTVSWDDTKAGAANLTSFAMSFRL